MANGPPTLTLHPVAAELQRKCCQNMSPAQPADESTGVPKGLVRKGRREAHEPNVGRAAPTVHGGQSDSPGMRALGLTGGCYPLAQARSGAGPGPRPSPFPSLWPAVPSRTPAGQPSRLLTLELCHGVRGVTESFNLPIRFTNRRAGPPLFT